MKYKGSLMIALCAATLLAHTGVSNAGERRGSAITSADGSRQPAPRYYRKQRPLQVNIYARRRGGYSYRAPSVLNTYGAAPPPYAEVRQTPSGPFDSGFFFDSGIGPRGGNAPYLH
jgi:hypothetical protein